MGASVQGTSHVKRGIVCQDAHDWRTEMSADGQQWIFAAVADGAGSAERSDEGATEAVRKALEAITQDMSHEAFDNTERNSERGLQALLTFGMEEAMSAVKKLAESEEAQLSDFSSTLLLLVAGPSQAAAAQVGDGAVVCKTVEGEYNLMTVPQNGEYHNQTTFITSDGAQSAIEISCVSNTPGQFALFTDGIEQVALDISKMKPHAPFFEPFFQFATQDEIAGKARTERLKTFLQSPRLKGHTDDDLTLLLASRSEKPTSDVADDKKIAGGA